MGSPACTCPCFPDARCLMQGPRCFPGALMLAQEHSGSAFASLLPGPAPRCKLCSCQGLLLICSSHACSGNVPASLIYQVLPLDQLLIHLHLALDSMMPGNSRPSLDLLLAPRALIPFISPTPHFLFMITPILAGQPPNADCQLADLKYVFATSRCCERGAPLPNGKFQSTY